MYLQTCIVILGSRTYLLETNRTKSIHCHHSEGNEFQADTQCSLCYCGNAGDIYGLSCCTNIPLLGLVFSAVSL